MAATQPSATLSSGSLLGRYEILTKVAAGGMAEVYVARVHNPLGFTRLVAVKVLHQNLVYEDQFISMFLDEARLAARIRHPNVVGTVDVGEANGCVPFLVMEYIEGDHLGKLLGAAKRAEERLPVPVALRILCDALSGLSAAHALCDEQGKWLQLVHRDVSPHNIMVGCDGVGRLTDFGVAKAEDRLTHTREGQVKGKLSYMAPEQASTGETDHRSDLFSAGVILWEALTGRRLFRAENTAATLTKILHEPIPKPSSVDPALAPLDAVLARALSRSPDKRFPDADAFAAALEKVAPQVGGMATRREVGALVTRLAEAKLERDRTLISAASHGRVPSKQGLEVDVEVSAVNLTRTARSAGAEGRSFATMPAGPAARRRRQSMEPNLLVPPAAGALNASCRSRFRFGKRATVLLVGLSAFATMLWWTQSRDSVRVVPLVTEALPLELPVVNAAPEQPEAAPERPTNDVVAALPSSDEAQALTDVNAATVPAPTAEHPELTPLESIDDAKAIAPPRRPRHTRSHRPRTPVVVQSPRTPAPVVDPPLTPSELLDNPYL